MPTFAEMFETIRTWNTWNTAADGMRSAAHRGRPTVAENYRTDQDEHTVDPLHVLRTTTELIESLDAGRFDMITEARSRGATWDQIGDVLHQRPDAVRCEYTAMVDYIVTHRPSFTDLDRCRAAL